MKFETAVKKSGLTMEQVKLFQRAALSTWQYVAYDMLSAVVEAGGSDSIPRSHVIEIVLDADYMTGGGHLKDPTVIKWKDQPWKTQPKDHYEVQKALIAPAFPFSRYGM